MSRSYMYRSSDSLRTRISRIRSILNSSPSMSSMVMEESAIEMTSSAERGCIERIHTGLLLNYSQS